MKILQCEPVGGASGDMMLGALFDLGVAPDRLRAALEPLGLGPFTIETRRVESHGVYGTQTTVRTAEQPGAHRHWPDIRRLIEESALPEPVREHSLAIFRRLAEAEAAVHQMSPDAVHFHEVGAVDSIVDIVGACLGWHELGVERVAAGVFPLGYGLIACAHGVIPSPGPATLELLRGRAVETTAEPFELVTPTGAALLTLWPAAAAAPAGARLERVGYGVGHHPLHGRPNVLRAMLMDEGPAAGGAPERCLELEFNVDDTNPELLGVLAERLMEEGALDVFSAAVQMKKQRPGTLVTVLCRPEQREALLDLVFRESTTLGVRECLRPRTTLPRREVTVTTAYGPVRVKIGTWRGEDVVRAPEMEDCRQRAAEARVPVRRVYEAAWQQAQGLA